MTHWDPFAELQRLQGNVFGADREGRRVAFRPAVDIVEKAGTIVVQVELPGVKPEHVDVHVEKGVLTVRGERRLEHDEKDGSVHRIERVYGAFTRSFSLPDTVDADAIDADLRDGVLTLSLPKKAAEQPRRIAVKG